MPSVIPTPGGPVTAKQIHPSNTYLARVALEKWNPATNAFAPWTGASVLVTFSEDAAGTEPIAALTDIPLLEVGVAAPGVYAEAIPGPTMAALTAYVGETIYQLVRNVATGDILVATALYVQSPRWAQ